MRIAASISALSSGASSWPWKAASTKPRALESAAERLSCPACSAARKLAAGNASVTDLARAAEVNPGAMTRLLDKLEARGLIERFAVPSDRRALDIRLTEAGRRFAESEITEKKRIFAQHLLAYLPLAAHIRRVLDERPNREAPKSRFSEELQDHMTPEAAEMTLRSVINWGRFAEIFAYDDDAQRFTLENPS